VSFGGTGMSIEWTIASCGVIGGSGGGTAGITMLPPWPTTAGSSIRIIASFVATVGNGDGIIANFTGTVAVTSTGDGSASSQGAAPAAPCCW